MKVDFLSIAIEAIIFLITCYQKTFQCYLSQRGRWTSNCQM